MTPGERTEWKLARRLERQKAAVRVTEEKLRRVRAAASGKRDTEYSKTMNGEPAR